jgi:hypothetical protein
MRSSQGIPPCGEERTHFCMVRYLIRILAALYIFANQFLNTTELTCDKHRAFGLDLRNAEYLRCGFAAAVQNVLLSKRLMAWLFYNVLLCSSPCTGQKIFVYHLWEI